MGKIHRVDIEVSCPKCGAPATGMHPGEKHGFDGIELYKYKCGRTLFFFPDEGGAASFDSSGCGSTLVALIVARRDLRTALKLKTSQDETLSIFLEKVVKGERGE